MVAAKSRDGVIDVVLKGQTERRTWAPFNEVQIHCRK